MKELIDLTGQHFGKLTVMSRTDDLIQPSGQRKTAWKCKCECGKETIVMASNLKRGITKSCGCLRHKTNKRLIDLTNQKFGKLTVIQKTRNSKNGSTLWLCECECGSITEVYGTNLRRGTTLSCGCYQRERAAETGRNTLIKHGQAKTRIYHVWVGMKQRCNDSNSASYPRYGGRGIKVCDEWEKDFYSFFEWSLSHGYKDDLSIDRIDNDKGYSPDNCRWATSEEQGNNRSTNKFITIDGEVKTYSQWARIAGISSSTIAQRIKKGIKGKKLLSPKGGLNDD